MNVMSVALSLSFILLSAGLILSLARLWRGPSLADRVVALDCFSSLGIGLIAAYAIWSGQDMFLDIAILLALIAFLGTVAFAKYLERRS